ncbi:MAG TPA: exodeoxyribonuclease VII large subunit [Solirubrobacteraceae bacterium]|nr:exodeoxyribonuclease VII large subunit [Solirubrobacteraceae bacterium]
MPGTSRASATLSGDPAPSRLPGPFPVGAYAGQLRRRLREFTQVQLSGEVWGLRVTRARVYFELRDPGGALPCAMWRADYDALGCTLTDGTLVIVGGGCDYYPGNATSSPAFSFAVRELRIAGEGDLLAQLERLRRRLEAEGLFAPQKALRRPMLPHCIGVVCAPTGKARDDVLAGLRRRGWAGRLVWADAPVQDRHAAPAIAARLRELAATPEVEVVIVARGGGSLADLFAFCDEMLCRTVALLRVPVIASVGHHSDRTLIDDVAAVCCSTPTHAAEAAVPIDLEAARRALHADAARLRDQGRRAVLARARTLAGLSRAPASHLIRQRGRLHQTLRELRAAARRSVAAATAGTRAQATALERGARRGAGAEAISRGRELERLALALSAHDPERTLARGYALVTDEDGAPLQSAAEASAARSLRLHFHDGAVAATVPPLAVAPTAATTTTVATPTEDEA